MSLKIPTIIYIRREELLHFSPCFKGARDSLWHHRLMGLFKIKNSSGEEPLTWIMDWLMEMKPRVSEKERILSEEGKQVGSVPWAIFPAWSWVRMTLVKEKFPNRFAQFWSHQAGEKQPNTTEQAGKSRELKLIIKTNELFVSFSIWHRGFELLRWKLYLEDSRDFMAMLNRVLGSESGADNQMCGCAALTRSVLRDVPRKSWASKSSIKK